MNCKTILKELKEEIELKSWNEGFLEMGIDNARNGRVFYYIDFSNLEPTEEIKVVNVIETPYASVQKYLFKKLKKELKKLQKVK